jgi:hypothetical protein
LDWCSEVLEHRVTGMMLWVLYMAVQDLLKDEWIQTILSSPGSISSVPWGSWVLIFGKASLPVIGGIITYKSDSWAKKGRETDVKVDEEAEVKQAKEEGRPAPPPPKRDEIS